MAQSSASFVSSQEEILVDIDLTLPSPTRVTPSFPEKEEKKSVGPTALRHEGRSIEIKSAPADEIYALGAQAIENENLELLQFALGPNLFAPLREYEKVREENQLSWSEIHYKRLLHSIGFKYFESCLLNIDESVRIENLLKKYEETQLAWKKEAVAATESTQLSLASVQETKKEFEVFPRIKQVHEAAKAQESEGSARYSEIMAEHKTHLMEFDRVRIVHKQSAVMITDAQAKNIMLRLRNNLTKAIKEKLNDLKQELTPLYQDSLGKLDKLNKRRLDIVIYQHRSQLNHIKREFLRSIKKLFSKSGTKLSKVLKKLKSDDSLFKLSKKEAEIKNQQIGLKLKYQEECRKALQANPNLPDQDALPQKYRETKREELVDVFVGRSKQLSPKELPNITDSEGNTLFHRILTIYVVRLHYSKQPKATKADKAKLENLLRMIELLIQFGFSPYQTNHAGLNAFEVANAETKDLGITLPNWQLIKLALPYIQTSNDVTRQIKEVLVKYCEETIKKMTSWGPKFYNPQIKEIARMSEIAFLANYLYKASVGLGDLNLFCQIEALAISAIRGRSGKSSLFDSLTALVKAAQSSSTVSYFPRLGFLKQPLKSDKDLKKESQKELSIELR